MVSSEKLGRWEQFITSGQVALHYLTLYMGRLRRYVPLAAGLAALLGYASSQSSEGGAEDAQTTLLDDLDVTDALPEGVEVVLVPDELASPEFSEFLAELKSEPEKISDLNEFMQSRQFEEQEIERVNTLLQSEEPEVILAQLAGPDPSKMPPEDLEYWITELREALEDLRNRRRSLEPRIGDSDSEEEKLIKWELELLAERAVRLKQQLGEAEAARKDPSHHSNAPDPPEEYDFTPLATGLAGAIILLIAYKLLKQSGDDWRRMKPSGA